LTIEQGRAAERGRPHNSTTRQGGTAYGREIGSHAGCWRARCDRGHGPWEATPAQKCASSKLKETGKRINSLLECDSNAVKKGEAVDPLCLQKVIDTFAEKWAKAEAKGGCATTDELAMIEGKADGLRDTLDTLIGLGDPGPFRKGTRTPAQVYRPSVRVTSLPETRGAGETFLERSRVPPRAVLRTDAGVPIHVNVACRVGRVSVRASIPREFTARATQRTGRCGKHAGVRLPSADCRRTRGYPVVTGTWSQRIAPATIGFLAAGA
jgi:hypothetical protein